MTTINVNLRQCDCGGRRTFHSTTHEPSTLHLSSCAGAPQPLPCRVPGSFACEVALGECSGKCGWSNMHHQNRITHFTSCPARPIRVSASINSPDGSWEKSKVVDAERSDSALESLPPREEDAALLEAARDRWALFAALVLGRHGIIGPDASGRVHDLERQRDAVFAALADMAMAEQAEIEALERATSAVPGSIRWACTTWGPALDGGPRSQAWLGRYVEHLIEQVGVL